MVEYDYRRNVIVLSKRLKVEALNLLTRINIEEFNSYDFNLRDMEFHHSGTENQQETKIVEEDVVVEVLNKKWWEFWK